MTFLRYSKLMSSSLLADWEDTEVGDPTRGGVGEIFGSDAMFISWREDQ
jgi:hypothetical protein